jgi:pimeloyl-ACP methyl ester carboxylesterase
MRETLVFIPGTLCDERVFAPQLSHFETRYHCQVVIPQGAATMEGMAHEALESIEAPSFNLVGFSLGGILAMAMLPFAHQRIKRLALLNTNHLPDHAERQTQRTRFVAETRAGGFHDVLRSEIQSRYLGPGVHDKTSMLNHILDMALAIGPSLYIDQMLAARDRKDATPQLKAFKGPTLLLCGDDDTVCPPEKHYAMQDLVAGSLCVTLPNTGHYSTFEAPGAVNEALETWLALPGNS